MPRGWLVRLCVAESHRDPDVFPEPGRYDLDRFLTRRYDSSQYSPFGWGRHLCNGVTLTHMISRVVLEELASHYDWDVTGGDPPTPRPAPLAALASRRRPRATARAAA
jgi:cytochrome P450